MFRNNKLMIKTTDKKTNKLTNSDSLVLINHKMILFNKCYFTKIGSGHSKEKPRQYSNTQRDPVHN